MTLDALQVDEPTVVLDSVSKWYGQKVAVSDVTCSFGPGVTGLLGPNGAGKTTLLRLITGLVVTSRGTVTVLGHEPRRAPSVYGEMSLVPEDEAVYDHLSAREFIRWSADLCRVDEPAVAVERAIRTVDLAHAADRKIGTFSKGMRQRAKVAAALVHDPQVLFLDEPLNGADPVQRASLIDLFVRLGTEGRTVVVSSHVLAEVERMADRVIAMVDGRLAAAGTVHSLRDAMSDIPRKVRIDSPEPRRLAAELIGEPFVQGLELEGEAVHVQATDRTTFATRLPALARARDIRITRVEPEDESLESVFRYLVGGEL